MKLNLSQILLKSSRSIDRQCSTLKITMFLNQIDSVGGKTQSRLSDVQFSEDDVGKKSMKLREDKAPGADEIAPRLLKHD